MNRNYIENRYYVYTETNINIYRQIDMWSSLVYRSNFL